MGLVKQADYYYPYAPAPVRRNGSFSEGATAAGLGASAGSVAALGSGLVVLPFAGEMAKKHMTEAESEKMMKLFGKSKIPVVDAKHALLSYYAPNGELLERDPKNKTKVNRTRTELISAPKRSYAFAHELGHASGPMGAKTKLPGWFKKLYGGAYTVGNKGSMFGLTGLAASARAAHKEETGEDSGLLRAADYAGKLGTGVMLGEEGQATARALKNIHKLHGLKGVYKAIPALLPAYGTYAGLAAGNQLIAPYITKKVLKDSRRKEEAEDTRGY